MDLISMEEKRVFCDVCKEEINVPIDRVYFMQYGEKQQITLFNNRTKKGILCKKCLDKIDGFIRSIKK